jgi:hypothetical protein
MELHSETFNPADFAWRGLTLTPAAAAHIHELVAKKPEILGVRLGVKQTGCAGFGYVLDTVTEPEKDDLVFETDGAKLYVAFALKGRKMSGVGSPTRSCCTDPALVAAMTNFDTRPAVPDAPTTATA